MDTLGVRRVPSSAGKASPSHRRETGLGGAGGRGLRGTVRHAGLALADGVCGTGAGNWAKTCPGGSWPRAGRQSLGLLLLSPAGKCSTEDAPGILQRGAGEGERPPPSLAALQQPPSRREQAAQQKSCHLRRRPSPPPVPSREGQIPCPAVPLDRQRVPTILHPEPGQSCWGGTREEPGVRCDSPTPAGKSLPALELPKIPRLPP